MLNRKSQIANRKSLRGVNYETTNYYMQNKPNFQKAEMNIISAITKDYENKYNWTFGENKPNQTQFQPKNEANKPNQTQFQPKNEANKPNQTQFQPKNEADKPKQSQSYPPSDYPCVFELAGYNLVLRNDNCRNFDGEGIKWQKHRRQTQ